jgi:hypothetical protein
MCPKAMLYARRTLRRASRGRSWLADGYSRPIKDVYMKREQKKHVKKKKEQSRLNIFCLL